jgi:hypothetical protein
MWTLRDLTLNTHFLYEDVNFDNVSDYRLLGLAQPVLDRRPILFLCSVQIASEFHSVGTATPPPGVRSHVFRPK